MSLLGPDYTVQASSSMSAAIASLRSWIGGQTTVCVVIASLGAGKSHLLRAAGTELQDPVVMPADDGSDCTEFIARLRSGSGLTVIADDLDRFSKGLREEVIEFVAAGGHSLLASMEALSPRMQNMFRAKCPDTNFVFLDEATARPQDIEAFVNHWVLLNGIEIDPVAVQQCADVCSASGLPQGFRTVEQFLGSLLGIGWSFVGTLAAPDAASAYRQATSPPPTRPIILVEGYTDRLYFEWILNSLPSFPDIEVRDCGGATIVAQQAIALRNQNQPCIAVLDSDEIGKRLRSQLAEFGHPVVSVPTEAVNLPSSAYDHVQRVAEIEDLLPASLIEKFLSGRKLQAELEIRAPSGVRYVIDEKDKRDLARWIVEETDREETPKLTEFFFKALNQLGVSP